MPWWRKSNEGKTARQHSYQCSVLEELKEVFKCEMVSVKNKNLWQILQKKQEFIVRDTSSKWIMTYGQKIQGSVPLAGWNGTLGMVFDEPLNCTHQFSDFPLIYGQICKYM